MGFNRYKDHGMEWISWDFFSWRYDGNMFYLLEGAGIGAD